MGLSDRKVAVPDVDAFVLDLESVIDGAGLERVVLWGSNFGGPIAVRYAARHSDRVSRLILDCSWARPEDLSGSAEADRLHATMIELMRVSPDPALAYTSYLADPTPEQRHEDRVERARKSIEPEMLAELYGRIGNMNVEADAARINVPTLVLHRRSGWVPFAAGRRLASAISRRASSLASTARRRTCGKATPPPRFAPSQHSLMYPRPTSKLRHRAV